MARTCLFCCVLIQVLLITVNGKLQINCPNQTGIEGKPLHLSCNVSCENCNSTECKWTIGTLSPVLCTDLKRKNMGGKHHVFNYTTDVMNDSQTVKFWVQMNTGQGYTTFNVTIESRAEYRAESRTETLSTTAVKNAAVTSGRSNIVGTAVLIVLVLAMGIMMVVIYRRNYSELWTCKNITRNYI